MLGSWRWHGDVNWLVWLAARTGRQLDSSWLRAQFKAKHCFAMHRTFCKTSNDSVMNLTRPAQM